MQTETRIVVRPTEIDVNGHVNNAKFVEYLEWGREEWYEQNQLPYERLHELGAITVTVHIELDFRRECRQGEWLVIRTWPDRVGRTSFTFAQTIHGPNDELAIEAKVTLVTVDPQTRRPCPVPEHLRRVFPV